MIWFLIGLGVGVGIELLTRISQSGEAEPDEPETEPVSISNGTIFKTLLGFGILGWLFRRKK